MLASMASIPITSHKTNRSPVTPATDYKPPDQTKGITPRHMDNNSFTPQDHHPSDLMPSPPSAPTPPSGTTETYVPRGAAQTADIDGPPPSCCLTSPPPLLLPPPLLAHARSLSMRCMKRIQLVWHSGCSISGPNRRNVNARMAGSS